MQIDSGAQQILKQLERAGHEAYVVGGCVRDALMGIEPKDWDITTSAKPEEVKAIFPRTFDTGIEHGTVSVLYDHETYEVTTYRIDGVYSDHRRPDAVVYTSLLYEDLARRDFTINAMAYHPQRGLIDYFDGQLDLAQKRIRCVGNPLERFEEDALRMLRAIRFSARLGFSIEKSTQQAICQKAPGLAHVSRERVADELTRTLLCDQPQGLSCIVPTGLAPWISQEFEQGEQLDFLAPARVEKEKSLRYAALLYPLGQRRAGNVLEELKLDNATKRTAVHLLAFLEAALPQNGREMRLFLHRLGAEVFKPLCSLKYAAGKNSQEELQEALSLYETEKEACVTLSQLSVSGRDLLAAGAQSGKQLGALLQRLLDLVMEHPEMNEKEKLLQYFRENRQE